MAVVTMASRTELPPIHLHRDVAGRVLLLERRAISGRREGRCYDLGTRLRCVVGRVRMPRWLSVADGCPSFTCVAGLSARG